jgi:hypothetical protein
MSRYFRIVTVIEPTKHVKKHSLRVGSATMLDNGRIACTLDVAPLRNWDGSCLLIPVEEDTYEEEEIS